MRRTKIEHGEALYRLKLWVGLIGLAAAVGTLAVLYRLSEVHRLPGLLDALPLLLVDWRAQGVVVGSALIGGFVAWLLTRTPDAHEITRRDGGGTGGGFDGLSGPRF